MIKLLEDKKVKTRKPHKCHGCREDFKAGSSMYFQKCLTDDHGFYTVYTCESCDSIKKYYDDWMQEGYPEGFSHEMKQDERFSGTYKEFLGYLKLNCKPLS